VALALAVSVAEKELIKLLEATEDALIVTRAEAVTVNVFGEEPV
jgi:hypothetical protein